MSLDSELIKAAFYGHVDVVRLLLERGADAGVRDNWGRTPLDIARETGHVEIARIIKEYSRGRRIRDVYKRMFLIGLYALMLAILFVLTFSAMVSSIVQLSPVLEGVLFGATVIWATFTAGVLSQTMSAIEVVLKGKQPPARGAGEVGLGGLVEALEMAYSRGKSCEVSELLEVLKTVNELERVYGLAEVEREGGGSLRAMGLLVIREYVKEAVCRLSTGGDPSALLGEALSVAKALQELEALAEKGARIVGLGDLEVVGYVEGKPVYSLKPRDRPDR